MADEFLSKTSRINKIAEPCPESLENRLKNLNASNLELKSEILKLEHKVDQLQENVRNQETVISQL